MDRLVMISSSDDATLVRAEDYQAVTLGEIRNQDCLLNSYMRANISGREMSRYSMMEQSSLNVLQGAFEATVGPATFKLLASGMTTSFCVPRDCSRSHSLSTETRISCGAMEMFLPTEFSKVVESKKILFSSSSFDISRNGRGCYVVEIEEDMEIGQQEDQKALQKSGPNVYTVVEVTDGRASTYRENRLWLQRNIRDYMKRQGYIAGAFTGGEACLKIPLVQRFSKRLRRPIDDGDLLGALLIEEVEDKKSSSKNEASEQKRGTYFNLGRIYCSSNQLSPKIVRKLFENMQDEPPFCRDFRMYTNFECPRGNCLEYQETDSFATNTEDEEEAGGIKETKLRAILPKTDRWSNKPFWKWIAKEEGTWGPNNPAFQIMETLNGIAGPEFWPLLFVEKICAYSPWKIREGAHGILYYLSEAMSPNGERPIIQNFCTWLVSHSVIYNHGFQGREWNTLEAVFFAASTYAEVEQRYCCSSLKRFSMSEFVECIIPLVRDVAKTFYINPLQTKLEICQNHAWKWLAKVCKEILYPKDPLLIRTVSSIHYHGWPNHSEPKHESFLNGEYVVDPLTILIRNLGRWSLNSKKSPWSRPPTRGRGISDSRALTYQAPELGQMCNSDLPLLSGVIHSNVWKASRAALQSNSLMRPYMAVDLSSTKKPKRVSVIFSEKEYAGEIFEQKKIVEEDLEISPGDMIPVTMAFPLGEGVFLGVHDGDTRKLAISSSFKRTEEYFPNMDELNREEKRRVTEEIRVYGKIFPHSRKWRGVIIPINEQLTIWTASFEGMPPCPKVVVQDIAEQPRSSIGLLAVNANSISDRTADKVREQQAFNYAVLTHLVCSAMPTKHQRFLHFWRNRSGSSMIQRLLHPSFLNMLKTTGDEHQSSASTKYHLTWIKEIRHTLLNQRNTLNPKCMEEIVQIHMQRLATVRCMPNMKFVKSAIILAKRVDRFGKTRYCMGKDPKDGNKWTFPAGKLDYPDLDHQAAARELGEEAGIYMSANSGSALSFVHNLKNPTKPTVYQNSVIVFKPSKWKFEIGKQGDELLEKGWYTMREIMNAIDEEGKTAFRQFMPGFVKALVKNVDMKAENHTSNAEIWKYQELMEKAKNGKSHWKECLESAQLGRLRMMYVNNVDLSTYKRIIDGEQPRIHFDGSPEFLDNYNQHRMLVRNGKDSLVVRYDIHYLQKEDNPKFKELIDGFEIIVQRDL